MEDPAWEVIDRAVRRHPGSPVRVEPLGEHFGTCTLKANSLLQAVTGLDDSYDVVAILDADVIPHRTWLRELVGPFRDDRIVATTGNRWYMPTRPTLASLVRYAWNAGAAVQMHYARCTWGGSMAVRASIVRSPDLQQRWRRAVASDTALDETLRQADGLLAFVPSLMSINRESCTFHGLWRFVQRQLLHSRLKGRDWPLIFGHGTVTVLVQFLAAGLLIGAGLQRNARAAAIAAGGLAVYELGMLMLLGLLEAAVRKATRDRGEPTRWLSPGIVPKFLLAIPLAQLLYSAVLLTVSRLRDVSWRGVDYRVEGRSVRLVRYQPYRDSPRPTDAPHSL